MIKIMFFVTLPILIFAQSYMAKIEPYEESTVYAQASGQIVILDKNDETKIVKKEFIKIDDSLERQQLSLYQNQLSLYNEKLKIAQNNYDKFITLKGKSQVDKDDKYDSLLDMKISIDSTKLSIAQLKDTINKKSLNVNNLYIKEFLVNKGDYVSIGSELATVMDISKSKLVVYVSSDDYANLAKKIVFVDGKTDVAKIEKIDLTPDKTFVSAYKVVLVLNNSNFGQVVKVEFKDE